jgi:hypothetical protein
MTATLPEVAGKKKQGVESVEQQAAAELVRLAREQGLSRTGPDGLQRRGLMSAGVAGHAVAEYEVGAEHDAGVGVALADGHLGCGLAELLGWDVDRAEAQVGREGGVVEAEAKNPPRSLTGEEVTLLRKHLAADDYAVRAHLPDLVTFMLGTGVRIGESLAVLWSQVDLEAASSRSPTPSSASRARA